MKFFWNILLIIALLVAVWTISISIGSDEPTVDQKAAQMLINDAQALDEAVLNPRHWHVAIFNGVEYTVYTGPGQAVFCRPYREEEK